MQYNKVRLAVGLFVITLFIMVGFFLGFMLKEKGTFDKRYNFHFQSPTAEYLHIGMPLKLSGFYIGVIDDITLKDDGSVVSTFSVTQENRHWLSEGSVLMSIKPLIGHPYIVLYASLDSPLLEPDSSLMFIVSDDINDLVSRLEPAIKKAANILNNVDIITTYLASDDSELKQILRNLNTFSKKLADNDSLLTSMTGDEKSTQSVIESLHQTTIIMKDLKKITDDISKITSSLDTKIITPASSSMKEIEGIMKDIKSKLDSVDGTVKAVGAYDKDLLELKDQLSVGIQKSNQLLDKVDSIISKKADQEVHLP